MEGGRPEWTDKLRLRAEEHRNSKEKTGKEVETQRERRQGKPKGNNKPRENN